MKLKWLLGCWLGFSLLLLASCQPKTLWLENKDEWGFLEKFEAHALDSIKNGAYYRYYPKGALYEQSNYKHGFLEGERRLFHEDGYLEVKENYKEGKFEGEWLRYWPNGRVKLSGIYQDNAMTGEWKKFYESGKISERTQFVNNEENGAFFEYYENGNLKAKGHYLHGDYEQGELELYNEEGELIKRMDCDKGICRTLWEK
jgi:antitoxin component YwqK of YwqJK toxin-antitoxin module